ncbi:MAG: phosphomannomutase/phosphoglucomutase [Saccharospirillum sp.]
MALLGSKKKKAPAEKSARPAPVRAANRGVLAYLWIPMVAIALAVGAAAWWVIDQTVSPVNETHQSVLVDQIANQYEAYFNNVLAQHQSMLEQLARSDDIVSLVQNARGAELQAAEERLSSQIPYALEVHLFPAGEAQTRPDSLPPLGFAAMDMIRRTEQGQTVPIEAHQNDGLPYLHSVNSVRDNNGQLVGTLSISQDMAFLRDSLNGIDASLGNVVVVQQFTNGPQQTLLTYGVKTDNPVQTLRSSNPNWQLTYQPSDALTQSSVIESGPIWVAFGLILVVALVTMLLSTTRLQAVLRHDGNLFARHMQRLLGGQPIEHQDYALAIFNTMAKSMNRMRMGKGINTPRRPVSAPATTASDAAPMPLPAEAVEEDVGDFDVSMMESDSDILGMDQPAPATMQYSPPISASLFRSYDVRGIMGETLDSGVARTLGLAIGSEAFARGQQSIVVGRDARLSSPELAKALVAGLLESGRDVIDIGVVPTPLTYYATQTLGATSCVMVTGSHLPGNHNGLKVVLNGTALDGSELQALYQRIEREDYTTGSGSGSLSSNDISANYINRIVEDVHVSRPMKVVIDCGNGVAGNVAPKLVKSLGCHVLPLYCDVDGNFPNHHPDPTDSKNLQDLARTVVETRADIGIAFDGDGDRIGVVSNSGKVIHADRLLMLLAKDMITRNPGATVLYDVKCSRRLHGLIVGYGGKPLMWKTGHPYIKRKMRESGALLAGEMSGHIYYKERWYGFDDALYTMARLLEILSTKSDSLDTLFSAFPEDINTRELAIAAPDDRKFRIVEQLQRNASFDGGRITDIDGLRVDYPDGWGLIRASNTSPRLVCRFEADTDLALKRIQEAFRSQLQAVDSQLQVPF